MLCFCNLKNQVVYMVKTLVNNIIEVQLVSPNFSRPFSFSGVIEFIVLKLVKSNEARSGAHSDFAHGAHHLCPFRLQVDFAVAPTGT